MATRPYKGWQSPGYAFAKRAGQQTRAAASLVSVYDQVGTCTVVLPTGVSPVTATGTFTISFVNTFVLKPTATFGSEIAPNFSAVTGMAPSCVATVTRWITTPAGHATTYTGAVISVTCYGQSGLQMICHYAFKGKAMSNLATPVNDTGDA